MNKILEQLQNINCNTDEAIKRLHNREETYLLLIKGFPEDSSMSDFLKAFELKNYENAYRYIHSLKGLSASFGFTDLFNVSATITKAVQDQEYEKARQLFGELQLQYCKIISILEVNA